METNTTTETNNFEHLIANSITKFLTAKEHLGTVIMLRSQMFEGIGIAKVITKGLNANRRHFEELEKLIKSIDENPYLLSFIESRGERFKTEMNKDIAEKMAGKTMKSSFDSKYQLDRLKDAALDLFSLMHAKQRALCFREEEAETDTIDPQLAAELKELEEVIQVLNEVLYTQPERYWEALYRYN